MISKRTLNELVYFDIETASNFDDLSRLMLSDRRTFDLWMKRSPYYRSAYEELKDDPENTIYLKKASLEPEFSRVICVSFGLFGDDGSKNFMSFCDTDETELLDKACRILENSAAKGSRLCGHNIKGFDIPFLGKRILYNKMGLPTPLRLFNKKPWEITHLDTSEIFSFGSWSQQKYLSLDLLANSLGIKSSKNLNIDGSKVNQEYWRGNIESIKNYCEEDVRVVMEIMESITE
jgi:predicted PolB exonuclease-like 3'-5' exonuclease